MRTWLAAALACALCAALFWPGFLSPDSLAQLAMARSGRLDDWHPPLMAALWRPLDRLYPGPAGMLLFQLLLFWSACALLARELFAARYRPWAACAPLLLPPVLALLGTVWKDVLLGALLLFATALLLGHRRRPPRRPLAWAAVPLLLCAAVGVRYNAFAAALPLTFWWARLLSRHGPLPRPAPLRSPALLGAAASLAILAGALTLSRALTAHRSFTEQAIWLHDLAALSVDTGQVLYPRYLIDRTPPATLEAIAAEFDPLAADPLLYGRLLPLTDDARLRGQLFRAWASAVARHPLAYLRHRLRLGAALAGNGPRTPTAPYQWGVDANRLGVSFTETAPRAWVHGVFERLAGTPVFAAWPWLLALGLGLWRGLRAGEQGEALAAVCASGLCYAASNVLLAPVTDFSYSWWCMLAGLVALGLLPGASSPHAPAGSD